MAAAKAVEPAPPRDCLSLAPSEDHQPATAGCCPVYTKVAGGSPRLLKGVDKSQAGCPLFQDTSARLFGEETVYCMVYPCAFIIMGCCTIASGMNAMLCKVCIWQRG